MKSAEKSGRYMTRKEAAAHFGVSESAVRQPKPGSRLARLRLVRLSPKMVRYLRSDVAALDRELERAAMTPYGQDPPAPVEIDHTGDEDHAS